MKAILTIFGTLVLHFVYAQSQEDLVNKLTGGNSKKWIFEREEKTLGKKCIKGEADTFFKKDYLLKNDKCIDGDLKSTSSKWVVSKNSKGQDQITIHNKTYLIRIYPDKTNSKREIMELITLGSQQPPKETIFKVYRYEPRD